MTNLIKTSRFFPEIPSLFSGFYDDDFLMNFDSGNKWLSRVPAANVMENDKDFVIDLAVPGMNKKDFHIDIENGNLCIKAEKEERAEEGGKNFMRKEFSYSTFSRNFILPETVDPDKIEASYKDGVLKITLPKKEEVKKSNKKEIKIG